MNHRTHDITRRSAIAAIGAPFAALALARLARAQDAAKPEPPADVDATPFPSFVEEGALTGTVRCVGSSSVGLLLNALRPGFRESQERIEIEVISSGSASGPKALASREALLAPMSRPMKPDEIKAIESARKGTVDFIDIAIDAIGICVNARNPMTRVTLRDFDRIFGVARGRRS